MIRYEINFEDNKPIILNLDPRDLIKASALEVSNLILAVKKDLDDRERDVEAQAKQHVDWFLKNAISEDKIDKWSELENHCHALSNTGWCPPPMQFDDSGNFKPVEKTPDPTKPEIDA